MFCFTVTFRKRKLSREKKNSKPKNKQTREKRLSFTGIAMKYTIIASHTNKIEYEKNISAQRRKQKRIDQIQRIKEMKRRKRIIHSTIKITESFRIC